MRRNISQLRSVRRIQSVVRQFSSVSRINNGPFSRSNFTSPMLTRTTPFKALDRYFCSAELGVQKGDIITVNFKATVESGEKFDNGDEPVTFKVGKKEMLPGFDMAVRGMKKGEKKEIKLAPKDAFGDMDPQALANIPINDLPKGVKVGEQIQASNGQTARVTFMDDTHVKLDLNHPLAGKSVTFDIEVIDCTQGSEDDGLDDLKIETLKEGDGVNFPKKGDALTMHYTGTLASTGAQFDCSRARGAPFQFTIGVGQVIEGWDEGVMSLSVGQRVKLHIPSAMGYGERGAGGDIPPNSDLVFDVELLQIN